MIHTITVRYNSETREIEFHREGNNAVIALGMLEFAKGELIRTLPTSTSPLPVEPE